MSLFFGKDSSGGTEKKSKRTSLTRSYYKLENVSIDGSTHVGDLKLMIVVKDEEWFEIVQKVYGRIIGQNLFDGVRGGEAGG